MIDGEVVFGLYSDTHLVYIGSLELWYNTILVLLTGNMENAEVTINALSIW